MATRDVRPSDFALDSDGKLVINDKELLDSVSGGIANDMYTEMAAGNGGNCSNPKICHGDNGGNCTNRIECTGSNAGSCQTTQR